MGDRVLVDAMLGTLATHLRMCGYDAAYVLEEGLESDEAIRRLAREDGRRLLTRDETLAGRTEGAVLLRSRDLQDQLRELTEEGFDLTLAEEPSRCGGCNGPLEAVGEAQRTPAYAPDPGETGVWRCRDCGQYFWKGSHWDDVAERLERIG